MRACVRVCACVSPDQLGYKLLMATVWAGFLFHRASGGWGSPPLRIGYLCIGMCALTMVSICDTILTIQAWRPYRKKDIDKLEIIQRRATKMIPELRDLSYESRLLQCGLTTLETRRLRGEQIEVFKIVNGYEDVDRNMFFKHKEGSRTRGH